MYIFHALYLGSCVTFDTEVRVVFFYWTHDQGLTLLETDKRIFLSKLQS